MQSCRRWLRNAAAERVNAGESLLISDVGLAEHTPCDRVADAIHQDTDLCCRCALLTMEEPKARQQQENDWAEVWKRQGADKDDFYISKVKLSGSKLVCPCADSLNPDSLCEMATA